MILARYILIVDGPDDTPAEEGSADVWERQDQRVMADMPARLEEVEENLTDLLPEGYSVRIEVKE